MRDLVRAAYGDPVGVPAPRAGVRVGDDVLAASGRVARGRGLDAAAPAPAGRTSHRRPARLVQGGDRQLARPSDEGRPRTGPSPVDRGRTGSKHHVLTDGHGTPLALILTGGNRNDVTRLLPLLDKVPPIRGRVGRPRRPSAYSPTAATTTTSTGGWSEKKGIKPRIARRGVAHGSGLGVHRYVVERTIGLLHWFQRLRIRWEIRDDIHEALMALAAAIICWRRLVR
ncbi:transposase [Actinomadura rubrisoli]|uniref:transposase n=1 Tax=Actinomadura rubrisoli TaxID=2530368 RepID=UPI003C7C1142